MPHVLAFDHEHDHLGDVGGVVGEALQAFADREQPRRLEDHAGIGHHARQELGEELRVVNIDGLVAVDDLVSFDGIAGHERIECVVHHALRGVRHARDLIVRILRAIRTELGDPLADVDPQIANALEIGDELERRGNEAQIGRDRLATCQDLQSQLVDLELQLIDVAIQLDRALRQLDAALEIGAHGEGQHLFYARAHQEHAFSQSFELALVFSIRVTAIHGVSPQPKRPVM
jgi:hypothetical protein